MKTLKIIILFLMLPLISMAEELSGRVVDILGNPMSYVSIYLKDAPGVGTVTASDGTFVFDVDFTLHRGGDVVFSFIGYKTEEISLVKLKTQDHILIELEEQPIMLEAAEVMAKISRRKKKEITRNSVDRFIAQFKKDFPSHQYASYPVVSNLICKKDNRQLYFHEVLGSIVEQPYKVDNEIRDSVRIEVESVKQHQASMVDDVYEKLNDMAVEASSEKHRYTSRSIDDQSIRLHSALWGTSTSMIVDFVEDDKLARWDLTMLGDYTVLIYTYSKNILGMAKLKLHIYFYLDPATYRVAKIAQSIDGELNIPFGYKLDDELVELINMFQLDDEVVKKYRLRRAKLSVKRNLLFEQYDGKIVTKEKNIDLKTNMEDKKGVKLNYSAQAWVKVIGDVKHK